MVFNPFFRPPCHLTSVDQRVYETRVKSQKIGFPVKEVKFSVESVCVNDDSYRCSVPDYDPDDLEKRIETGENLDVVNCNIMTPDRLDDLLVADVASLDNSTSGSEE